MTQRAGLGLGVPILSAGMYINLCDLTVLAVVHLGKPWV